MHFLVFVFLLLMPALAQAQPTQFVTIPDWTSGNYPPGYLVKFNGTMWICGTVSPTQCTDTPGAQPPGNQWNSMAGLIAWSSATSYQPNQQIVRQGTMFTASISNTNKDPAGGTNQEFWKPRGVPTQFYTMIDASKMLGADMGAKIQSAHNSEECNSGCFIWVPAGTYTGVSTVTITKPVIIAGAGSSTTILRSSGATILAVSGVTINVRDIRLDATSGSGTIMTLTTSQQSRIQRVSFLNGSTALSLNAVTDTVVDSCIFDGYTTRAINSQNATVDSGDNTFLNNLFAGGTGATNAYSWSSGGGVRILNNKFLGKSTTTLAFNLSSGDTSGVIISGNSLEGDLGTVTTAIRVASSGSHFGAITISNNAITTALPTTGISIEATTGTITDVVITNNVIGAATTAINLSGAVDDYTISANAITGPGGSAKCMAFDSSVLAGVVSANHCAQNPAGITSSTSSLELHHLDSLSFAIINAMSIANGSQVFCSDCTLTTNMGVCSASGGVTGVYAFRISGAWRCQ